MRKALIHFISNFIPVKTWRKKFREEYKEPKPKAKKFLSTYYNNRGVDVISTAFNFPEIIEYQIKLIKKNLKGSYTFIVCDNSSDNKKAQEIYNICKSNNITYFRVRIPKIDIGFYSHARALNWIYKKIIRKRKNSFLLIDCDLFPVGEFNVDNLLQYPVYGAYRKRENTENWYIWPGYSFFNYEVIKNKKLDFMPPPDSGGKNYDIIYKYFNKSELKFPGYKMVDIVNNQTMPEIYSEWRHDSILDIPEDIRVFFKEDFYKYCVEYLDEVWLHAICGTNWTSTNDKNSKIYKMLDEHLNSMEDNFC